MAYLYLFVEERDQLKHIFTIRRSPKTLHEGIVCLNILDLHNNYHVKTLPLMFKHCLVLDT